MSGQLLSSKVVIVEEEPKVRGIPSAPTSVAGAVGVTERGPIGEAVLCTSFDDFQTKFGGFTPDSDLPLAAMGFFENGGAQLWVVRTTHYSNVANAATATAVRAAGFLVAGGGPTPGILLGASAIAAITTVWAQTGGGYDASFTTIDSGGQTVSGGSESLRSRSFAWPQA